MSRLLIKRGLHKMIHCRHLLTLCLSLFLATAGSVCAAEFNAAELDDETNGTNWLAYGRTHSEQRYSPLDEINAGSINKLGLAWSVELPDARQLVATTLAVDGVLYVTGSFSIVTAIDARTQKVLWKYGASTSCPAIPTMASRTTP
jgi:quinohemoprotein ethanol dehydrogenase